MADAESLFDAPEATPSAPRESATVRRTRRQLALLAAGRHPLSAVLTRPLRLHSETAPYNDRQAPGRRCGNCQWRTKNGWGFPKCGFGEGTRASFSEATDCRAWWPACIDHEPKDT